MGRFANLALKTLEENNPKAVAEMRRAGSLAEFLRTWEKNVLESIGTRDEALWKAGDPMAAAVVEAETVREALENPLFSGSDNVRGGSDYGHRGDKRAERECWEQLTLGHIHEMPKPESSEKSSGTAQPLPRRLLPIRAPTQEEWDGAMRERDAELAAKAPRDKDGKPVLTVMPANDP